MRAIPMMPIEYKGYSIKQSKYDKSSPRKWTKEEEEWCLSLRNQGYTMDEIAISIGREYTATQIKLKRLGKVKNTYNRHHIQEKYDVNEEFLTYIKPKTILDVYCGTNKFYIGKAKEVITNDIDSSIKADYNIDSLKLMCKMYYDDMKFDFIDLDPYGSSYHCLELALLMAKKGLAITLGEMGHLRFKRLDYVRRVYGINSLNDFTSDNIIIAIQEYAKKFKKELIVYKKCDWKGISRVWFTIKELIITEQWEDKNNAVS